jgi:DNA-binding transcriptional MerR regulator
MSPVTRPLTSPEVAARGGEEWTVDELAQRAGVPVRTIREYQTIGLVHRPRRAGRIGLYDTTHLRRLQLIARLQDRGYSLAGINDLLSAWRGGDALTDILRLEPDELVHVDEPGAPAALDQLARLLPALVPERLEDLLATGVVEACGTDRYCVPSPSLLQLTVDALEAGIGPDAVLDLLDTLCDAADTVTDAVLGAVAAIPSRSDRQKIERLVGRGRGLLAHGLGRLTLYRLGRRVGVSHDDTAAEITERLRTLHRRSGLKGRIRA